MHAKAYIFFAWQLLVSQIFDHEILGAKLHCPVLSQCVR